MIKVNLLSPERKEVSGVGGEAPPSLEVEKESKISTGAAVAAAVITIGVIGFLYITQTKTLEDKQKQLHEQQAKKKRLEHVEKTLKDLERAKNELSKKVELIGQLKSRRHNTVKMMDELSNALPEWVWLTSLRFSGTLVTLQGKTLNNNLIADFINNLKATNSFISIEFKGSTKKKQGGSEIFSFNLTCIYREKPTKKVG
jgi:Tfp pilus assembly protein PilN